MDNNDKEVIHKLKNLLLDAEDCPNCGGSGILWVYSRNIEFEVCGLCNGSGRIKLRGD